MVLLTLLATAVGAFAVFCLMLVGLVETPWPILLGGLLLALYGLQRLSVQSQMLANQALPDPEPPALAVLPAPPDQAASAAAQPAQSELVYRGVRYSPTGAAKPAEAPAPASSPSSAEGTYRGQPWQRTKVTSLVQPGAVPELTYRGRKVKQPQRSEETS